MPAPGTEESFYLRDFRGTSTLTEFEQPEENHGNFYSR